MGTRLELQDILEALNTALHVYFQPPADLQLQYPAIIYAKDQESKTFADNNPYRMMDRYQISVLDSDPDSVIPSLVSALPLTTFVRRFTTQSLYHSIYTMYF